MRNIFSSCQKLYIVSCKSLSAKATRPNFLGPQKVSSSVTPYGFILLSVPVGTFVLGTWQLYRWRWKLSLIEELNRRTSSEPGTLPDNLDRLSDMEYFPVRVRGTYDHTREMYVGPRSPVPRTDSGPGSTGGGLVSVKSSSGFHVVTPFKLIHTGTEILVNRGWVSRAQLSPSSRAAGQLTGEQEIVGLVRLSDKPGPFTPRPSTRGDTVHHLFRDVDRMSESAGTAPVFLDLVDSSDIDGTGVASGIGGVVAPVPGQTRVALRNSHLEYIFTWYCLSAFTAFMWYKRVLRPSLRRVVI